MLIRPAFNPPPDSGIPPAWTSISWLPMEQGEVPILEIVILGTAITRVPVGARAPATAQAVPAIPVLVARAVRVVRALEALAGTAVEMPIVVIPEVPSTAGILPRYN